MKGRVVNLISSNPPRDRGVNSHWGSASLDPFGCRRWSITRSGQRPPNPDPPRHQVPDVVDCGADARAHDVGIGV